MTRRMCGAGVFIAAVLLLSAGAAAAEDKGRPAWLPFIELGFDIHKDFAKAEVNTYSPTYNWGSEEHWHNSPPGIRMGAGLLTPAIEALPGKPRTFFDVGVTMLPESKQTLLEVGTPDAEIQLVVNGQGNLNDQPNNFAGGGSKILNDHKYPIVNAGLGMEFTLPWIDQRIRLRPSVEYEWERIVTNAKLKQVNGAFGSPPVASTLIDLQQENEFHSLGIGAEIEFVVIGGLSMFLEARALWLLGDDKVKLSDAANTVEFVYNRNDNPAIHGSFGFRYSFVGLKARR